MIKNFLFHRVSPERDPLWDPMDIRLFERCVRHIASRYRVELIEDIIVKDPELMNSRKTIATIVFDDGYKDNIQYAAEILDRYKLKASFYVVTDCIEQNIPTWTYLLDFLFQKTQQKQIDMRFKFLPQHLHVQSLNTHLERIEYARKLKPVLKKVTHDERNQVMKQIVDAFSDIPLPRMMMNWNDLRELHKAGFYIGSHTRSHCMLGTMNNEKEIWDELKGSGDVIRQELGYFPVTISYPVGSYDRDTIRLSKEAGYKLGLAVKQKPYRPQKDDRFEIPRIELYNESWFKTRLRMANMDTALAAIRRRS